MLPWAVSAYTGSSEAIFTSVLQLFMQAVVLTSGLPPLPIPPREAAAPGHMPWSVVMPLRLGMRACTSRMFASLSTKSAGTKSARFNR